MSSKVQVNVSFNIQWTIEEFLSLSTKKGDFLQSPYYIIGSGTRDEARWKFYLYPRGTMKYKEEFRIEILVSVEYKEERRDLGLFSMCILDLNDRQCFKKRLTHKINSQDSFTLSRFPLMAYPDVYLPGKKLKILCTTPGCDLPYHWNMRNRMMMCSFLRDLRISAEGCDVTLVAPSNEGEKSQEIKAHKSILCARSAVFNRMFSHNFLENRTNCVHIPDISIEAIKVLVNYCYFAEYEFTDAFHAMEIYRAAHKYEVEMLKSRCLEYIRMHLSVDILRDLLQFSRLYEENEMFSDAMDFLRNHIHETKDPELLHIYKLSCAE